jgi:hypothetical protein
MARPNPKVMLNAAKNYLKQHPEEIVRALKGAFGLRIGVPLDSVRYLAREMAPNGKVRDVVIDSAPPGIRLSLTVDAVGSTLRVSLVLYIEEVQITTDEIRMGLRVAEMSLKVLEGFQTPVAALVQSGALDLSKPGNLVAFIPKRPAAIVDAKDDRVVVDLMRVPQLAANPKIRRILAITTPVLGVRAIRSKDDHLDLHLKATLSGLPEAMSAARSAS